MRPDLSPSRRGFLFGAAGSLLLSSLPRGALAAASPTVDRIADHFSSIRTMAGDFIQFGPRGEQTGGKFFIQRPGKVRFNYENPSAFRVIADGKSVQILNPKLKTSEVYALSNTPLKLLLDDRIDLSSSKVKNVKEEADAITVQLVDKKVFGNARITLMFSTKDYDLLQWTITDQQGKDTTVLIDNVKTGVSLDPKLFRIDYESNKQFNQKTQR